MKKIILTTILLAGIATASAQMTDHIHNIQANTPIENIAAMVEAVKEFNGDR